MRSPALDLSAAALAGAILMTGCVAPAASEPQRDRPLAVDQVAGFWALTAASGGARCSLSLSNFLIEGRRPVLVESCSIATVAAAKQWRATPGGFELLDEGGAVLLAFRSTGEDAFDAVGGDYRLTRSPM